MLANEAVETVRSMLTGSQIDEISTLSAAYDHATDSSITLKYAKRSVAVGSTITVGLNTFTVVATSGDGQRLDVIPSMDGGPNVDAPVDSIVRIRPQFTTWALFRELQSEIDSMSSPATGLFYPQVYEATTLDRNGGIYAIPDFPTGYPFRLLRSEYLVSGTTQMWSTFTDAYYNRQGNYVRVYSDPPQVGGYRFSLAFPFGQITDLTTDLTTIGITNALAGIAMLGVASTMALGWEGRRTQPVLQGDSRRSAEVPVNGNASLARQWRLQQQAAITEEVGRLATDWGYKQAMSSGFDTVAVRR
jgi:hypothetical protein